MWNGIAKLEALCFSVKAYLPSSTLDLVATILLLRLLMEVFESLHATELIGQQHLQLSTLNRAQQYLRLWGGFRETDGESENQQDITIFYIVTAGCMLDECPREVPSDVTKGKVLSLVSRRFCRSL